jgi:AcrR family transcriptional regulator
MKYSREYILRRAFDVFMNKGYDSASISVLQEELQMSRGAMYRYFRNKEELFNAVVDEYFFKIFDKLLHNTDNNKYTIEKFIEVTHRRQKILINAFTRAGVTHTVFLNYTALVIQAAKYYPDFLNRFRIISGRLLNSWREALRNSVEAREVRKDIDIEILAILFNNASVKETSDRDCEEAFAINVMHDMERRKQVMDYLYSLIKI